ncbi:hypothetical protein Rhe02_67300 [Rhizocola hellebori]|uniref:Uncharacterized protein n=1 Tax=Rhizocola hellebori TaxID=1392758 RepID=A0A8J3QFH7_9ACTN|nr:hypothetical protein Rhe02_67300 [Rhizocola hellebori]
MAEVSRASTRVPVCLKDHCGQPGGLQPQRGGQAGHPAAQYGDLKVLNTRSEHAFKIDAMARLGKGLNYSPSAEVIAARASAAETPRRRVVAT